MRPPPTVVRARSSGSPVPKALLLLLLGGAVLAAWRGRRGAAPGCPPAAWRPAAAPSSALPVAPRSALPGLNLAAQAHRLLPLTNFSALTTVALLDAHPGASSAERRELVRLHQELYCRWRWYSPLGHRGPARGAAPPPVTAAGGGSGGSEPAGQRDAGRR
jgi:hypothetical protein